MKMENLRVVNYFPKLAFTPPNEKKCTVEPFNSVVLLTIRQGRHGFCGRGRGKNFTAQGRHNDKFWPERAEMTLRRPRASDLDEFLNGNYGPEIY